MDPDEKMIGQAVELLATRRPVAGEMDAYERVLGDAMEGEAACLPGRTTSKRRGESSIRS